MKINFMALSSLQALKQNIRVDIGKYSEGTPENLLQSLGKDSLISTGLECEAFKLKKTNDPKDDIENVKMVYGRLKDIITPSMASDERFWAGLAMNDECWQYVNARWKGSGWTVDAVKEHFFFAHSGRRSLTRNALSRLWWIGFLTHDPERKGMEWHYTDFICSNQRYIVDILERNTSNNTRLTKTCIDACERFVADHPGKVIDSEKMRELQKYLSILGGTYLIDEIDNDVLMNKIIQKIESLF